MDKNYMKFEEAMEKFKPDFHTEGFKSDGDARRSKEVIRYYFKNGKEMFFHIMGWADVVLIKGTRTWDSAIIKRYKWVPMPVPEEDA